MRRGRSAPVRVLAGLVALALVAPSAEAKPKKPAKPALPEVHAAADTTPPIITHVRVTRAPVGQPIVVRAKLDDEHEIFMPAVYVRVQGTADFDTLTMTRGVDGWEATIPARSAPVVLEYFLEAFDDQGNGPSREGSPEAPIRLVVGEVAAAAGVLATGGASGGAGGGELPKLAPKDEAASTATTQAPEAAVEDDGIATKWWFWTIVGVGVTGAVIAAVLALQGQGGRVDAVDITVLGPDPTRGAL